MNRRPTTRISNRPGGIKNPMGSISTQQDWTSDEINQYLPNINPPWGLTYSYLTRWNLTFDEIQEHRTLSINNRRQQSTPNKISLDTRRDPPKFNKANHHSTRLIITRLDETHKHEQKKTRHTSRATKTSTCVCHTVRASSKHPYIYTVSMWE